MSGEQFLRQASLVVSNQSGKGLELGEFRIKFETKQACIQSPGTLWARIYNLSPDNEKRVQEEFTDITLKVGYGSNPLGVIFQGQVRQWRRGRESNTDTYLDLYCAAGDEAYNFATIAQSVPAGSSLNDRVDKCAKELEPFGITAGFRPELPKNTLPRGKVQYGMVADELRQLGAASQASFFISESKLVTRLLTGYIDDQPAIVLTSKSGLIGRPEQTQDGIRVRCLINPTIRPGRRVKIDNKSINVTSKIAGQSSPDGFFIPFDQWTAFSYLAAVAADGFYAALVVEHRGDTRSLEWYSELICLAAGDGVPPSLAVKLLG